MVVGMVVACERTDIGFGEGAEPFQLGSGCHCSVVVYEMLVTGTVVFCHCEAREAGEATTSRGAPPSCSGMRKCFDLMLQPNRLLQSKKICRFNGRGVFQISNFHRLEELLSWNARASIAKHNTQMH